MPSDRELNKLSDEHKAMLAQKCVLLLMGRKGREEEEGMQKAVSRWRGVVKEGKVRRVSRREGRENGGEEEGEEGGKRVLNRYERVKRERKVVKKGERERDITTFTLPLFLLSFSRTLLIRKGQPQRRPSNCFQELRGNTGGC